jgi:hypothetical protein
MAAIKLKNNKVLLKNNKASCTCCSSCNLALNFSGGEEGFLETFPVNTGDIGFDVLVEFKPGFFADRLLIQGIYDTGCVGAEIPGQGYIVIKKVTIPPNTQNVTIQVIPNCLGNEAPVFWEFQTYCLFETPAP